MLSPEAPYPLNGGGPFRTASLLHYFARYAEVDLIQFSESGEASKLPSGCVRSHHVLKLPFHSRTAAARVVRNAKRAIRGTPPLVDRFSGFSAQVAEAVAGKHFDVGIIEHLWCAPYFEQLTSVCGETILDLHNIESVLYARYTAGATGMKRTGYRAFAEASAEVERKWLPRYSLVLTASAADAMAAQAIAPGARILVYPNAIPSVAIPRVEEENVVVFPGNFEYQPNIDAIRFLTAEIWPLVQEKNPDVRLRLVGRGEQFIRPYIAPAMGIEVTGSIEDALPEIARGRMVIAPLRSGSGTRIKILQAWAAARPIVATSVAAEGLEAIDGTHLQIADTPVNFAAEMNRLLTSETERKRLGSNGRHFYEDRYTWDAAWRTLDADAQMKQLLTHGGYTEGSNAFRR